MGVGVRRDRPAARRRAGGRGRATTPSSGSQQRVRTITLPAERGSIFDRNGDDLAVSRAAEDDRTPTRASCPTPPATRASSRRSLDVERAAAPRRASPTTRAAFVYVARKVDDQAAAKVEELGLAGHRPRSRSRSASTRRARSPAPVLGFVGRRRQRPRRARVAATRRRCGASPASSSPSGPEGSRDPGGKRTDDAARRGERPRRSPSTSRCSTRWRSSSPPRSTARAREGGMAVIVDVKTGDILVDGVGRRRDDDGSGNVVPAHPATEPGGEPADQQRLRAGLDRTRSSRSAAALEEGEVTPDDPVRGRRGGSTSATRTSTTRTSTRRDDGRCADIVRESSNVGIIKIAAELGKERLDAVPARVRLRRRRPPIDFPGESPGLLTGRRPELRPTDMGSIPIGYTTAVTADADARRLHHVANGGVTRPPRLVAATIDARRHAATSSRAERAAGSSARRPRRSCNAMLARRRHRRHRHQGARSRATPSPARPGPRASRRTTQGQYMATLRRLRAGRVAPARGDRRDRRSPGRTTRYFGGEVAAPLFSRIMQYALRLEHVPPSEAITGDGTERVGAVTEVRRRVRRPGWGVRPRGAVPAPAGTIGRLVRNGEDPVRLHDLLDADRRARTRRGLGGRRRIRHPRQPPHPPGRSLLLHPRRRRRRARPRARRRSSAARSRSSSRRPLALAVAQVRVAAVRARDRSASRRAFAASRRARCGCSASPARTARRPRRTSLEAIARAAGRAGPA